MRKSLKDAVESPATLALFRLPMPLSVISDVAKTASAIGAMYGFKETYVVQQGPYLVVQVNNPAEDVPGVDDESAEDDTQI
jgi:hypothetical protein